MRNFLHLVLAACFALNLFSVSYALAEDEELDEIEAELDKSADKPKAKINGKADTEEVKVQTLSDLQKLAPFEDVSVLQRRYQPKTGRFQMFGGLSYVANDPWFWGFGVNGRFAYNFIESFGIELSAIYNSSTDKQVVKDLKDNNDIKTDSLVGMRNYVGAHVVWTPVYGKMSLFNKRIIPFDMYFSLGGGSTGTSGGANGPTIHFGTGQIFSLSKSTGFRWDLSWQRFTAKDVSNQDNSFDNIFLTFGMSWFFPEVGYR